MPVNPGNPYVASKTQIGFTTFGGPHFAALLCEVAYARPQGGLAQEVAGPPAAAAGSLRRPGAPPEDQQPISRRPRSRLLSSEAVARLHDKYGTYLMPMAFPEGSPTHPSYTAGHATVAGACVTILKALFDENFEIQNPVVPTPGRPGA